MQRNFKWSAVIISGLVSILSFQNCGSSFQSQKINLSSTTTDQLQASVPQSYFQPLSSGDDLNCNSSTTSGEFNLSAAEKIKISNSEAAFQQNRYIIVHPQPLTFPSSTKSWSDIYKENFSEIKNTFSKSESSFKIASGMSLFALENNSVCEMEQQLNDAFTQAEANDIPLLIHVDFEWMIEWRSDIWDFSTPDKINNKYKVEWSDWNTPIQKFAIFWDEAGFDRKSRICYSNPEIRKEVIQKGRLIAAVINKWRLRLAQNNKSHLFLGVDPSWETGIQDYSQLSKAKNRGVNYEMGYCALYHEGYSAERPPADKKTALSEVVRKYVELENRIFFEAGIPKDKIFTHIVGTDGDKNTPPHPGRLFYQNSPLEVAFNSYSTPGFSLYPNAYYPELIRKHTQGQDWAITETAYSNFEHLNQFAGNPRLKSISIYSWDMIRGNANSISELKSLMKFPIEQSKIPDPAPAPNPTPTPVPAPIPNPVPAPTPAQTLIGAVEAMSGSVISGWACLPGTTATSLEIYAGDFYGTKNLVTTIQTGITNSGKTTVCSGNSISGFSYQFTESDRINYQGNDIHIKAIISGKELWLFKPAHFTVPKPPEQNLVGAVDAMSGSVISGWACLPGTAVISLEIYAGDFYGTKGLVTTIQTGINNSAKTTVCSGNSMSGFSYQFTNSDKINYQGKDIHIKAIVSGKELWLFKPAAFVVPGQ